MKRLGHVGTRRQIFTAMAAAAAATVPFLASTKKSGAWPDDGSPRGSNGSSWGNNGSNGSSGGRDGSSGGSSWSGGGGPQHASCLLKGTMVSTPSGDRPVQDLRIGDEVLTLAGTRIIKWIGYNKFTKEEGKPWIDSVMPVRVARLAIDDHSPHSDLYLSPSHCVFVNGALIPVKHLINGTSIAQGAPSDMSAIEYYHIDLGTHEALYAEGALVESFFDGESKREHFSNFIEYERLYGPECSLKMTPFAPVLRYRNRREQAVGAARSLISNVVDVRDPVQIAHDQLARRAEGLSV
jgi:hypothetical protein